MSPQLLPTNYQRQDYNPGFVKPTPDYGTLQALGDSMADTFSNHSLGGSLIKSGQYKLADLLSQQQGLTPLTPQEFEKRFSAGGTLKWEPGMSRARAELMLEDTFAANIRGQRAAEGEHSLAHLVGGLVGSFHPVDILFGSFINRAFVFGNKLSTTERIAEKLSVPKAFKESFTTGLTENILQEGMVASTADYRQYEYSAQDFMVGVASGTMFSTGLGTARAIAANVSPTVAQAMAAAAMDTTMHGDEASKAADAATLDPRVFEAAQRSAKAKEAADKAGPVTDEELNTTATRTDDGPELFDRMTEKDEPKKTYEEIEKERHEQSAALDASIKQVYLLSKELGTKATEADLARAREIFNAQRKRLDDLEAANPGPRQRMTTKAARERSRPAKLGGSEDVIANTFKKIFGVEVRFYDGTERKFFGGYGATSASSPKTIFIESGSMKKMLYVAGHELGHTLRYRDPAAWRSIVSAIARAGDGSLRKAYLEARAIQGESLAWKNMDAAKRFDESVANVLGQALQSNAFWDALRKDRTAFDKVVAYLRQILDKMEQILRTVTSKETLDMYNQIASIINKVDPDKKSDPVWKNKALRDTEFNKIYEPYRNRFEEMVASETPGLRERALREEEFQDILDELAPEHGTLTDKSLDLMVVERNQFIRIDPKTFITAVLFRKYYPALHAKFAELKTSEERAALRKEILKNGPPFSFKQNADGSYDFYIPRNDKYVKWRENRDTMVDETLADLTAGQYRDHAVTDFRSEATVHEAMSKIFGALAYGRDAQGMAIQQEIFAGRVKVGWVTTVVDGKKDYYYVGHLRDFMLGRKDRPYPKDFADFVAEYKEFIQDRANKYLMEQDPRNNQHLEDRIKEITTLTSSKESDASKEVDSDLFGKKLREEAEAAYKVFVKEMKLSEDKLSQADYGVPTLYIGDAVTHGTPEAVKALRAEVKKELLSRLSLHKESIATFMDAEPRHYTMEEFAQQWIGNNIEKLVDERMRGIIPNYDRLSLADRAAHDVTKGALSMDQRYDVEDAKQAKFENSDENDLAQTSPDEVWHDGQIFDRMSVSPNVNFQQHANTTAQSFLRSGLRRTMRITDQAKIALQRLEGDATSAAPWTTNLAATVNIKLKDMYQTSGLDPAVSLANDIDLMLTMGAPKQDIIDARKNLAAEMKKLHPRDEELVSKTIAINTRNTTRKVALIEITNNQPNRPSADKLRSWELEELESLYLYHAHHSANPGDARDATFMQLDDEAAVEAFRLMLSRSSLQNVMATARNGVKALFSMLDGLARSGVKGAGDSVAAQKRVQVTNDTSALLNYIESTKMGENWSKNLITKAIILEIQGRQSGIPEVAEIARIIRTTHTAQMGRLNSLGGGIRWLNDYAFSAVHDRHRIVKSGFDTWAADMSQWIDWNRTSKIVGHSDLEGYLKEVFNDIQDGRLRDLEGNDPDMVGGNIARSVSRRRNIQFKEGYAFDYDMKYGSGDTSSLILSQFNRRAEQAVLMANFGPDYKATWNQVMADIHANKNKTASEALEVRTMEWTFRKLTGDLDHPVNSSIASFGQAIRSYVNLVASWSATISSVIDLAGSTATLRFMGMNGVEVEKSIIAAMKAAHKRGGSDSAWLRGQGAGIQALNGSFSRIMGTDSSVGGLMRKVNDFVFKYNGMNWWSRVVQESFVDVSTQHMGRMALAQNITPEFANWLKFYNISEAEFASMAYSVRLVEGMPGHRLSPDMIADPVLSRKLSLALDDSMRYALLEPSDSDLAIAHFGTQAGTVEGEAIRAVMQFKPFPITLLRKVNGRYLHAYGDQGITGRAMKEKMVMFASMMFLGWVALSIKDILRGREPMHFLSGDQWNTDNLTRLVAQAGTLGLFEDLFHSNEARQVSALIGPAGGMAYNLGRSVVSQDRSKGRQISNAVFSATPFASVPFVNEASKAMIGSVFSDAIGTWDQASRKRRRTITGQSDIFLANP